LAIAMTEVKDRAAAKRVKVGKCIVVCVFGLVWFSE
jgi:hypothetical protein